MKHIHILLSLFFGITTSLSGQNKLLNEQNTEIDSRNKLLPENLVNIHWRGETSSFTYKKNNVLFQQTTENNPPISLISLEDLNKIIAGDDTLKSFPDIIWQTSEEFSFYTEKFWILVNLNNKKISTQISLPENSANYKVFFPKKQIACTIDNNVFILSVQNKPVKVTADTDKNIVNGDIVSRNEFGINEGLFWSPNGNYLAFYRKDNSKVRNYPLVDITLREAESNNIKYPMAGMHGENISLGIYAVSENSLKYIEKDDTASEKYLTNISWAPDEKYIYIQVLNHAQNHMLLNRYRITDGQTDKTIFEESNSKYVEPLNPIVFLHKLPSEFIYQSRRDGFNHFYLYNTDGKLIKQLTSGKWEVMELTALDKNDNLFYLSAENSPLEQHLYKLNIKTNKKYCLTQTHGVHTIVLNNNSEYFIDNYSNTSTPRNIDLVKTSAKIVRNILKAENPLKNYDMPEMNIGTIKAADGKTDLYYRMIKPLNFDSTKKYPVIVYVYGGPHTQLITNRWLGGARLWDYMMAQKGYIIFTVDSRGSSNRGLEFENVIHRQCGQTEMKDQVEGITFLKSLPFTDSTRIGVHGWSYGGFMTTSLMVNYPEIFKVGVAGGPVIDWKYYEVMYGERYMDTPQENPEGYKLTQLEDKVTNLKGKLLIIHGAVDPTVVWQHSLLFIQSCIENNVPVDYFVYPLSEHNVRGPWRVHLMEKITDYFVQNL